MSGMTAVEKVFARACSRARVAPGDIVHPQPSRVFVHDGHVEGFRRQLDALGIDRISAPERVVFATDHEVVYLTPRAAERGTRIRATARDLAARREPCPLDRSRRSPRRRAGSSRC